MAGTVAGRQTRETADDVDIEIGLGDVEAQEVVRTTSGENRICRREGDQSGLGHARGCAQQQLFGHAHLEKALRERLGEDVHVGVFREISAQSDDFVVVLRGLDQCVSERGGGGALTRVDERGDHGRSLELRRRRGGHARTLSSCRLVGSVKRPVSSSRQMLHSCSSMRMKCAFSRVSRSATP